LEREKRLVQRAQSGDRSAFRQLVEDHEKKIYGVCYDLTGKHEDACDLSQDVFVQAYQALGSFRGDAKFGSWLYRIAVNLWLNRKRKKSFAFILFKESNHLDQNFAGGTTSNSNPEQYAESKLMHANIARALTKLSPRERSIFVLRHYEDLPLKEIAEILEIKLGTVKSLLFRALKKLQKELYFYQEEFLREKNNE